MLQGGDDVFQARLASFRLGKGISALDQLGEQQVQRGIRLGGQLATVDHVGDGVLGGLPQPSRLGGAERRLRSARQCLLDGVLNA